MAQFGSVAKGGYYPLSPEWTAMVAALFMPSKNHGRILDPFAGEGVAIEALGRAFNMLPFAIENDTARGRAVQERFGVINGIVDDCYEVQISQTSFPIVYLNPPYDTDATAYEMRRAEYKALQHFWKYIQFDGFVIWVVYAQHLTKTAAKSLFKNCNRVDVYRFPGKHLDHYTQVCVVGRRHNDKKVPDEVWIEKTAEAFAALAKTPEKIRDITLGVKPPKGAAPDYDARYIIPPTREVKFFSFVPRRIDPEALLSLYQQFGAQHLPAFKRVVDVPKELPPVKPVAKPRFGQLAVVMASGMIDGIEIEHNGAQALLRGSVRRVSTLVKEEVTEDSRGNPVTKEIFHNAPQSQIVMLSQSGEVFNISEDSVLVDFIAQHRDELMAFFEKHYPPAYDMTIDDVWGETFDTLKVKGEFDLLPTQEYVTAAATEHLMRKNHLIIVGEMSVGKTPITTSIIANLVKLEQLKASDPEKLESIAQRYGTRVDKLGGLKSGEVGIVLCPANLPSKWIEEIESMYPDAVAERLETTTQVRAFFERAEKSSRPHIGIISYEDAKLGESWKAAYNVHRVSRKLQMRDEATKSIRHEIATLKYPLCPTTGTRVVIRAAGELVNIPINKLENRQYYLEGERDAGLFMGYRWHVSEDGTKRREPVYRPVKDRDGLALFQNVRSFGLPKIGNGRVETEEEDVSLHEGRHTVAHRKIRRNLWPDEPVLDEWVAMQGLRCFDTSTKRSHIEKRMKDKKFSVYRRGGGDKKLDEMLVKIGVSVYYAGDGFRVPRNPRYPLAEFIARRYQGRVGLLVLDELHRIKAVDTDVGVAARRLCQMANKVVGLTGTLYGGVASSIYTIEFVFNRRVREAFPWIRGTPMHWISAMGVVEDVFETKATYTNGNFTGTKRFQAIRAREVPGCSPLLVRELLDHTLFVGLKDLGNAMPAFEEIPQEVEMDAPMATLYSHAYHFLKDYNAQQIMQGDGSFTGSFYQNCLALPDSMHRPNEVWHRTAIDKDARRKEYSMKPVMTIPAIGDYIKPKENRLAERLGEVVKAGERAIVFINQTGTRDIQDRIADDVIKALVPDAKPFILRATVEPDRRIQWVKEKVDDGHNILICNPKLVAEGVDLVWFNRTFYLEIHPSLPVMGQSSRRTWRLNQTAKEVSVEYLYYDDVFQNGALYLIADKTQAANILYGNEGGSLSALSENANIFSEIAKVVKEGLKKTRDEIAAKFNSAAYTNQDFLDSSWYAEPREKKARAPVEAQAEETPDGVFNLEFELFDF